ncbi:citrate synthase-like protein [Suillus subluteus]|nr:citrate synthase-like protein [Suillus subluteus]
MTAKLDQTAKSICGPKWAVARDLTVYEVAPAASTTRAQWYRQRKKHTFNNLDPSTCASLKLTVLNPTGRVWTMVAATGFAHEIFNYGEYSGAPSEGQRVEYTRTIHPPGIANFTNVVPTFKGIIHAFTSYKPQLSAHNVKNYVRCSGPNWQEGLKAMRLLGESLGVPIRVFGPDTDITRIVPLALGLKSTTSSTAPTSIPTTAPGSPKISPAAPEPGAAIRPNDVVVRFDSADGTKGSRPAYRPFNEDIRSFVYGLQPRAIQGMFDFNCSCKRARPSVAAMIYPFGGHHIQKFHWGTRDTLLPVYPSLEEAVEKHPGVDLVVNFASSRSVYNSTMECLGYESIKTIALIAESVPERQAREILWKAKEKGVLIIVPATVGEINPGCFRIGHSGGVMDNIIAFKLYRPGSVGYISKSGGMSNELNSIHSLVTNGTYEGIAIDGDRYPGSTFINHLRCEADLGCKLLVLLGEVGDVEEYRVIEAVKSGKIKKPIVAWAIGTCGSMFTTEVQFGHAGSIANSDNKTADAKNRAMHEVGFVVPSTFEELPAALKSTYEALVAQGVVVPAKEVELPVITNGHRSWGLLGIRLRLSARSLTIVDRTCSYLSWTCRLPSGSNAIFPPGRPSSSRWQGLHLEFGEWLGSRFGGALDEAASMFSGARDTGLVPRVFVDNSKKADELSAHIGQKIKSINKPDLRVKLVKEYIKKNFPSHSLLDYTLALILNIDDCIAVCFVSLLRDNDAFTPEAADEYIKIGALDGLFILSRSIGFIGHHLHQKRLRGRFTDTLLMISEGLGEDAGFVRWYLEFEFSNYDYALYMIIHICGYLLRDMSDTVGAETDHSLKAHFWSSLEVALVRVGILVPYGRPVLGYDNGACKYNMHSLVLSQRELGLIRSRSLRAPIHTTKIVVLSPIGLTPFIAVRGAHKLSGIALKFSSVTRAYDTMAHGAIRSSQFLAVIAITRESATTVLYFTLEDLGCTDLEVFQLSLIDISSYLHITQFADVKNSDAHRPGFRTTTH